jgi:hypothetical protein
MNVTPGGEVELAQPEKQSLQGFDLRTILAPMHAGGWVHALFKFSI